MLGEPENLPAETHGLPPQEQFSQYSDPALAPREVWTLRDLLLFVAFIPFAFLASDLLVLTGYVVLKPFMGWRANAESAQKGTFFLLTMQGLFYLFILGFLLVLSRIQHNQPFWRSLGWQRPTTQQAAGWIAAGGGLAVLAYLAMAIHPDTRSFALEKMFTTRAASMAIAAFAVGIAPVVEEVVFRGLLFAVCERAAGLRFAVVITAALFATLHIPEYWPAWNHIVLIFLVGLVFSLARGRSGALTPSILLHIGYNSLMIVGFFFST